jgi:hypothetical protein
MAQYRQYSADTRINTQPALNTKVDGDQPSTDRSAEFYRRVIEQLLEALGKNVQDMSTVFQLQRKNPIEMLSYLKQNNILSPEQSNLLHSLHSKYQTSMKRDNSTSNGTPFTNTAGFGNLINQGRLSVVPNNAVKSSQNLRVYKSDHFGEGRPEGLHNIGFPGTAPSGGQITPTVFPQTQLQLNQRATIGSPQPGPVQPAAPSADELIAKLRPYASQQVNQILTVSQLFTTTSFLSDLLQRTKSLNGPLTIQSLLEGPLQPHREASLLLFALSQAQNEAQISSSLRAELSSVKESFASSEQNMARVMKSISNILNGGSCTLQDGPIEREVFAAVNKVGAMQKRCREYEEKIQISNDKIRSLEDQARWIKEQSELKEKTLMEEWSKKLKEVQENLRAEHTTKVLELQSKLKLANDKTESVNNELSKQAQDSHMQIKAILELKQAMTQAQNKIIELNEVSTRHSKGMEVALKANKELEDRNKAFKERISQLDSELTTAQQTIRSMIGTSAESKASNTPTLSVNEKTVLTEKIIGLEKELNQYRLGHLNHEGNTFLTRKVEVLEEENLRLKEEIEGLIKDNEVMAQAIEDVEEGIIKGDIIIKKGDADESPRENAVEGELDSDNNGNNGDPAIELKELLRAAGEELKNMKEQYDELKIVSEENEAVISELRLKNDMLIQENLNLKRAAHDGNSAPHTPTNLKPDSKSHDELVRENEELVEILKRASDEIKLLRSKYAEAVTQLNEQMKEADCEDNDDFINAAEEIQQSSDHRKLDELKDFNKGLWESVEHYKQEKQELEDRIHKLEVWCQNQGIGQPPSSNRSVEEKSKKSTPTSSQEELSMEQLIDLLLMTLQLGENIREVAVNDSFSEKERIATIVSMVDNFELFGENGKLDWRLMRNRASSGNEEQAQPSSNLQGEVAFSLNLE